MNEQLNEHWLLQLHSCCMDPTWQVIQSENTKSTISIKCFKCKWIRNTKENWLSALFKWTFMSIISLRAGHRHLASFPLNDQNINTSFLCWSALGTADPDPNQRGKKGARKTHSSRRWRRRPGPGSQQSAGEAAEGAWGEDGAAETDSGWKGRCQRRRETSRGSNCCTRTAKA